MKNVILLRCVTVIAVLWCAAVFVMAAEVESRSFGGTKSDWNGFECFDFKLEGRPCKVVVPKVESAEGTPWIWRGVFWGHEPQTEIALLNKGWHVAWIDCSDWLGSPQCMKERSALYTFLVEKYRFSPKPALIGMSRGGLCSLRWATENPDKVSCLYLDAPVCDLNSWPGGAGKAKRSDENWNQILKLYGKTAEEMQTCAANPINSLEPLAKKKVPILLVCGDADDVVPMDENGSVVVERYKKLDAPVEMIVKPGVGHHPHSLKDPAKIVDFILAAPR